MILTSSLCSLLPYKTAQNNCIEHINVFTYLLVVWAAPHWCSSLVETLLSKFLNVLCMAATDKLTYKFEMDRFLYLLNKKMSNSQY